MFRRRPQPRLRPEPNSGVRVLVTPEEKEAAIAKATAGDARVSEVLDRRQRMYIEAKAPRVRLVRAEDEAS
jgi:hypothetical protein